MMYKVDSLTLITGSEIIIEDPLVKIYQPKVKEIALIGEDKFFRSMNIFYIDPKPLINFIENLEEIEEEEKRLLINTTTAYDNLLFLMRLSSTSEDLDKFKVVEMAEKFFGFILKDYIFDYDVEQNLMFLISKDSSYSIVVDRELFMKIREIVIQMFLLERFFGEENKKTLSKAAQKIADKIASSEQKIKAMKNEDTEADSQIARVISILGISKELDYLNSLTIYQLFNQFERFNLFTNYDQGTKAALAGASNIELIDWYKKI